MRKRRVEERAEDKLAVWEARRDISLDELLLTLIEIGLDVSPSALRRFIARHGVARKKTGNATARHDQKLHSFFDEKGIYRIVERGCQGSLSLIGYRAARVDTE